ncbi:MAG: tRNA preQ1(34) S-adenosylmethionine ribosyltransferase-isomerase QueA [Myxococcales bacterium]|nr:tRNA preQ1(34) S-adenosylmethionine ribosyltransferase-isomerase QueA [Myxococcales bacterium]
MSEASTLVLEEYDYELPADRIAQHPPEERDGARLMVLDRSASQIAHQHVRQLPGLLREGDLLIRNATAVLPARLRGRKASGGSAEALLLGPSPGQPDHYRALLRISGRLRLDLELDFSRENCRCEARVVEIGPEGVVKLAFAPGASPYDVGEMPLPPYIRREAPEADDLVRYQTTYARSPGSIAAPTAGLHLSERLSADLAAQGIDCADLILHVGEGTFRPLRETDLARGSLPAERYEVPEATAQAIEEARAKRRRVVAVGTTSARVLETRAASDGVVRPGKGETELFLRPGSRFRVVDALLTNFHLPRSSLLLLVAAFAGRERLLSAYREAVASGYRFYSYGDAMLLL